MSKFGRRYNRHKTKHREYFEALAREVVQNGRTTVQFGTRRFIVDIQERHGSRRWLSIAFADGSQDGFEVEGTRLDDSDDPVPVIADKLMQTAANIPAVVVPPAE